MACANEVYLLCLPAHTTHILQPLDVRVFKSFKTFFSKACHKHVPYKHPGRVITADVIASLIAEVWPQSMTPLNIMGGFRKCGIYPLNPGAVTDRQLAPLHTKSTLLHSQSDYSLHKVAAKPFSKEQEILFKKRFEEGYNVYEPNYVMWLKDNHPEPATQFINELPLTVSSSLFNGQSDCNSLITHHSKSSESSKTLDELLVYPTTYVKLKRKKKAAINSKAVLITDSEILDKLKQEKAEKEAKALERKAKALEKEQKKKKVLEREKQAKDTKIVPTDTSPISISTPKPL